MASNFHNILGFLAVGLDFHEGFHIFPPAPEFPFWELVFVHPFFMGPNQKPKVKINGVNSVVDMHTPMLLWLHFPVIPDPLNALWPIDLIFGTQSCWLPRSTVLIQGEMSTCTIFECISVNLDCNTPGKLPTDLTLQFATVKTTPSLSDFIFGALRAVLSFAVDRFLNKALGRFKFGGPLADKIAETKLGQKITSTLGSAVAKDFGDDAIQQAGKKILGSFMNKMGLSAPTLASKTLGQFGFDPSRLLPQIKPGKEQSFNPFSGWKGDKGLDKNVPFYGAGDGIIQALGG